MNFPCLFSYKLSIYIYNRFFTILTYCFPILYFLLYFYFIILDVIGIVKSATDVSEIVSQKLGGKVLVKRDLILYDDSKSEIRLTVWGETARENEGMWNDQIVAVKGCKIGDYQGRTLGTTSSSSVILNPNPADFPEANHLNNWRYSDTNASQGLTSLSGSGGSGGGPEPVDKRKPLSSVRDEGKHMYNIYVCIYICMWLFICVNVCVR